MTLVGEGNGSGPAQLLGFGVVPYDGYSDGQLERLGRRGGAGHYEVRARSGAVVRKRNKEIYVGVPGDFIHLEQNEVVLDLESEAAHSRPRDVDDVMNLALDYKNQREGGHASTGARRGSR